MSYGVSLPDLYSTRRRLCRQNPHGHETFLICRSNSRSKFELVVSVGAAKTIGLGLSNGFLGRADEIIQ